MSLAIRDYNDLKQSLIQTEECLARVESKLSRIGDRTLELAYLHKTAAYFGRLLRRPHAVDVNDMWEQLETHLSMAELDDVLLLDLIVRGRPRQLPEAAELYLAVEISEVVDRSDVLRARRRADLLRKAGCRAVPIVAGEGATQGAEIEARQQGAAILQDGQCWLWDEAFSRALSLPGYDR
jgi:hypothetical protein